MTEEQLAQVQEKRLERMALKKEYRAALVAVHDEYRAKMEGLAPSKGRRDTKPRVRF